MLTSSVVIGKFAIMLAFKSASKFFMAGVPKSWQSFLASLAQSNCLWVQFFQFSATVVTMLLVSWIVSLTLSRQA